MTRPTISTTRRRFLKTTTAASAGVFSGLGARPSSAANEQLQIACIGTANRARANIRGVQGEQLAVFCDIDDVYLDKACENHPDARRYNDYREMIDREAGRIDAVVVSTADHHHVPASLRAVRQKLHVYCEKPLAHTVAEARLITEEARKAGVATQLGTQIHAGDNYRRVVEIIRSGAIGDVTDVHVWVGKGWGGGELPETTQEPPKNLHWDLWLGPAAERPYAAGRYHPAQWRRWWAFGNGTLGDMGCHYMDLPFWALNLKYPTSIEAEGPEVHPETCPLGLTVRYEFPSRGSQPALCLTWYDGNMTPKEINGQRIPGSGVMFVGSEGMLFADYNNYRLFPQEKFADFTPPPKTISDSIGHYAEWIKACREGTPTTCTFDYSGPLSETVLLGTVAYRVGRKLNWQADKLEVANDTAANALISKAYRSGWELG
jgi:predicted dehydrogenase